jgi:hypothetical protein
VRAITVGDLVIEDVALTGPADEVQFGNDFGNDQKEEPDVLAAPEAGLSSREVLKSRLQLAKLQLKMMKKKELMKKTKALLATNESSSSSMCRESQAEEQDKEENRYYGIVEQQSDTATPNIDYVVNSQDQLFGRRETNDIIVEGAIGEEDKALTKLEQLRHRQKELRQKNDIANLRNLIRRQKDLLEAQGQELKGSSLQLESCVESIKSKKTLLKESEKKLEEMHYRKRIVEGMVMRATEQLTAARRSLSEHRKQPNLVEGGKWLGA